MVHGRRLLVWHRGRDLRLFDNPLYVASGGDGEHVRLVSVYIVDPDEFTPRMDSVVPGCFGVLMGPHVAAVLVDALKHLREQIQQRGGKLLIRRGSPEKILPKMVRSLQINEIVWSEDVGVYEQERSRQVHMILREQFPTLKIGTVFGYSLYSPEDLPVKQHIWKQGLQTKTTTKSAHRKDYSATSYAKLVDVRPETWNCLPPIMGNFCRAIRTVACVRECLDAPESIHLLDNIAEEEGILPTFAELTMHYRGCNILGLERQLVDSVIGAAEQRCNNSDDLRIHTNEETAQQHIIDFITNYAATANRNMADVSNHQSARINTSLALGVLSPRQIYWTCLQHHGDKDFWLLRHLEMRDFFIYSSLRVGNGLFRLRGNPIHRRNSRNNPKRLVANDKTIILWKNPIRFSENYGAWCAGETGLPLVDAGMKEMMQTGYCSNRVRQNMASLLAKDLNVDWRFGAAWFQFCLDDHCVAANWGNWQYFSGVGSDPKNRRFCTVSQALKYDPCGMYVKKWLPELSAAKSVDALIRPWDLVQGWRQPIVDPRSQLTWQDNKDLEDFGGLAFPLRGLPYS